MKTTSRLILVGLLGTVTAIIMSCTQQRCAEGSVCTISKTSGPSAVPSATTTPTPSASPTASASPSATPLQCVLPASVAAACSPDGPSVHEIRVQGAQSTLPSIVYTQDTYVAALVEALKKNGACAGIVPGSPDEIRLKTAQDRSETFDVWNGLNFPQTIYKGNCKPAAF